MRLLGAFFLVSALLGGQPRQEGSDWGAWRFLAGEWVGEGSGQPGQGSGGFSFRFELGEKVLVRRNHADYQAANGKPAFSHQDLMVVYRDPGEKTTRAIYFDNEGHVIHYTATAGEDQKSWTFLSDPAPGPRYRLSYQKVEADKLKLKFEIAPPGKPFATYIEAAARRARR
jgi:hypothetical protein